MTNLRRENIAGEGWQTVPDSQPGAVLAVDLILNEPTGPSPNIEAVWAVPAGATVWDIHLIPVVGPWAAGLFQAFDVDINYYGARDLTEYETYDPTNVNLSINCDTLSNDGYQGGYSDVSPWYNSNGPGVGVLYPNGGQITAQAYDLSDGAGEGQMIARVIYVVAPPQIVGAAV